VKTSEWGGWGSNPRPTDYEKYGLLHEALYLHRWHGSLALTAFAALGLSGTPVHEPVHGRGAYIPQSCYCA